MTISYDLFGNTPSRKEIRLIQIIETSLKLFAKHGYDETNLKQIAKKCKITRPLLNHYFSSKDELFILVCKYIRIEYQKYVVAEMVRAKTPTETLKAYVRSATKWGLEFPDRMSLWLIFFHKCHIYEDYKELNTQLTQTGLARIKAMLEAGVAANEMSLKNIPQVAQKIQLMIAATLISNATENLSEAEQNSRLEMCLLQCLDWVT